MEPKISIIVPVYNVEKYIHRCIESILKQTFTDFELILVNDGSPDNCASICDQYASSDTRIKVIHKENNGLSSARNAGINLAKGKYIGLVDSDDFIDKRMFEILYNQAELYSSDIVVCDVKEVCENDLTDIKQENIIKECTILELTNMEALNQLYLSNDSMGRGNERWIFAVNKLYKRDIFDTLKYKEGRFYEDESIVHELYFKSRKVTSIKANLYYYVQRPNSIMNSPFSIKRFDRVYALKERSDFFKAVGLYKLHEKAFKCYLEVLLWNYQVGKMELNNISKDLIKLKDTLKGSIKSLFNNPYISWKQKLMVLLFQISPSTYFFVTNPKEKRLYKVTKT